MDPEEEEPNFDTITINIALDVLNTINFGLPEGLTDNELALFQDFFNNYDDDFNIITTNLNTLNDLNIKLGSTNVRVDSFIFGKT